MRLTVQTFLSLDGVMQAPGGPNDHPSDGFSHCGWQAPFPDPAIGEFVTELNEHASAFLFGRRTFDILRGHWPDQTDPDNPIATAINSLPKHVVSEWRRFRTLITELLTSLSLSRILKRMTQHDVDAVFRALADPTRRAMLERLDDGSASVTSLAEPFDVSLTAITQHVRVLERAQLITSAKHGRQRICTLERDMLGRAESWLAERRLSWDRRLDRLEQHLEDADTTNDRTKDPDS